MIVLSKYTFLSIWFNWIVNILGDCKDAQDELLSEIKEARKYLTSKGMKFDTQW